MDGLLTFFLVGATAFLISMIALFSGFGVGTVLMPVFALFFPLEIAIASTAVIHLANNIFKLALIKHLVDWAIVLSFSVPAIFSAALGAYLLEEVARIPPLFIYSIYGYPAELTWIGFIVGFIIILFSCFQLVPQLSHLVFPSKYIPIGGVLSGFFGGFSGHQGIFRSAFFIKSGLSKKGFIGTSVACSLIVDIVRVAVYAWAVYAGKFIYPISNKMQNVLVMACFAAFAGSYTAIIQMDKVTFKGLQIIVSIMVLVLGVGIALGII